MDLGAYLPATTSVAVTNDVNNHSSVPSSIGATPAKVVSENRMLPTSVAPVKLGAGIVASPARSERTPLSPLTNNVSQTRNPHVGTPMKISAVQKPVTSLHGMYNSAEEALYGLESGEDAEEQSLPQQEVDVQQQEPLVEEQSALKEEEEQEVQKQATATPKAKCSECDQWRAQAINAREDAEEWENKCTKLHEEGTRLYDTYELKCKLLAQVQQHMADTEQNSEVIKAEYQKMYEAYTELSERYESVKQSVSADDDGAAGPASPEEEFERMQKKMLRLSLENAALKERLAGNSSSSSSDKPADQGEEVEALRAEIEDLNAQLEQDHGSSRAEQLINKLNSDVADAQRELQDLQQQLTAKDNKCKELSESVDLLTEASAAKNTKLQRLEAAMSAAGASSGEAGDSESMRMRNEILRNQNTDLQKRADSANKKLKATTAELAGVVAELAVLKASSVSAEVNVSPTADKQVADLEEAVATATEAAQKAKDENTALQNDLRVLYTQHKKNLSELELKYQAADYAAQQAKTVQENQVLRQALDRALSALEASEEIDALQAELQGELDTRAKSEMNAKAQGTAEQRARVAELETEVTALQAQYDELVAKHEDLKADAERNEALMAKEQEWAQEKETLSMQLGTEKQAKDDAMAAAEAAEADNKDLSAQLAAAIKKKAELDEFAAEESQLLAEEMEAMSGELDQVKAQLAEAVERATKAEKEAEELIPLREIVAGLKQQLTELEQGKNSADGLLDALQGELVLQQEKLQEHEASAKSLAEQKQQLEQRAATTEQSLATKLQELEQCQDERDTAQAQCDELQTAVEQASQRAISAENKRDALTEQLSQAEQQLDVAAKATATLERNLASSAKCTESAQQQLDKSQAELRAVQKEVRTLQGGAEAERRAAKKAKKHAASLEKELADLQQQKEELLVEMEEKSVEWRAKLNEARKAGARNNEGVQEELAQANDLVNHFRSAAARSEGRYSAVQNERMKLMEKLRQAEEQVAAAHADVLREKQTGEGIVAKLTHVQSKLDKAVAASADKDKDKEQLIMQVELLMSYCDEKKPAGKESSAQLAIEKVQLMKDVSSLKSKLAANAERSDQLRHYLLEYKKKGDEKMQLMHAQMVSMQAQLAKHKEEASGAEATNNESADIKLQKKMQKILLVLSRYKEILEPQPELCSLLNMLKC